MSHITLKVRYKEVRKESAKEYPSVVDKVKRLYSKVNDYFGIEHGTSDIVWFYGFGAFCLAIVSIVLIY